MCAVCPESSGTPRGPGARGEHICIVRCLYLLLFALTLQSNKYKPKSRDINVIMWLGSHLACKKGYHIHYFIAQLFGLYLQGQANSSTLICTCIVIILKVKWK